MKKLLSFFLCAFIGTSAACADNLTYDLNSETGVLTISGTGPMERTFNSNTNVKEVIINEGVTSIPKVAFNMCTNLTSVTIAESVTTIGEKAFNGCRNLPSITIPKNVSSIGKQAFSGCYGLTTVTWNVANYPDNCLTNRPFSSVTTLIFGDDVVNIPKYFCFEMDVVSVTFGKNVQTINVDANFYHSSPGLETIVVSEENTKFDSRNNCNAVIETETNTLVLGGVNTIIPNNITAIGEYAFAGRGGHTEAGLVSIVIPEGVVSLGEAAFAGCDKLSSITIPNSVTTFGGYLFNDCVSLTSVDFPTALVSIGGGAFKGCTQLSSVIIPNSVTELGSSAFYGCQALSELKLPDGITSIGDETFVLCNSLDSVTVPRKVASIGSNAFSSCANLHAVRLLNDVPAELGEPHVFASVATPFTIYVPCNTGDTYRAAWSDLASCIVESECGSGIGDAYADEKKAAGHKIIRDGHLFIECNGKVYNAQGKQLK